VGRGKVWACDSVAVPSYTIQTLPGLRKFHVRQFQTYAILKRQHIWNAGRIFPCGNESAFKRMVAEEYCWATTQAAGRWCCGLSDSSALESIFRLEPLERTYTVGHMYTQFRVALSLPARNYSLSREVSVQLLRSIGSVEVKPHIKWPEHKKKE
jgi:hypothetical protein